MCGHFICINTTTAKYIHNDYRKNFWTCHWMWPMILLSHTPSVSTQHQRRWLDLTDTAVLLVCQNRMQNDGKRNAVGSGDTVWAQCCFCHCFRNTTHVCVSFLAGAFWFTQLMFFLRHNFTPDSLFASVRKIIEHTLLPALLISRYIICNMLLTVSRSKLCRASAFSSSSDSSMILAPGPWWSCTTVSWSRLSSGYLAR